MAKFLGLDSSTQSLSAVIIDLDSRKVVSEHRVNYQEKLPSYRTQNGVLRSGDPRVVHSPPLMWAEALDILFQEMVDAGVDLSGIAAVSGSGQQHGSVYLNDTASDVFSSLDPALPLREQLEKVFSRRTSPIWMDSSTSKQCRAMNEAMGGKQAMAESTGSVAFERFTGPQIRKFFEESREEYDRTSRIHLVSSFMASIITGAHTAIDHGDGAGMNLMDIRSLDWNGEALEAAAAGLLEKLPSLVPSETVAGSVSGYFSKYGIPGSVLSVVWSGDNPNSLIGVGLVESGKAAISLGTSDTYFGYMPELHVDPAGEGHVFGAPCGGYMSLICFKNGSLAREKIRDSYGYSWERFSAALSSTPVGNNGGIMLPYFDPEIVPCVLDPGVRRFDLDPDDADANCRAVVEAQMLSMKIHSRWMGVTTKTIYATGGASANREILKIMADVHDAEVYQFEVGNSAALGAALRAAHAYCKQTGSEISWPVIVSDFTRPVAGSRIEPDPEAVRIYEDMIGRYAQCEKKA